MRIWDLPPKELCRPHLLGEHRELHAIWTVLTQGKTGYAKHPETQRWRGRLKALFNRHAALVGEMTLRGYQHKTPLNRRWATGLALQTQYLHTPQQQRAILKRKGCRCFP